MGNRPPIWLGAGTLSRLPWKNFQAGNATDADTLLKGMEILENAGYIASDTLRWAVIAALTSVNRGVETVSILRGLEIKNLE